MEKTKDIPGWYQRLVSLQTKPASQITFKQYCRENEIKMKVLYPFLPQDQVKGKLLERWKRQQPQNFDALVRGVTKTANTTFKLPVVNIIPKRTNARAASSKKPEKPLLDWLTDSAISNKNKKTYKGRAFVLPRKIPEVVHLSQTSNPERSILKYKSTVSSTSKEKRQPASQVSFTVDTQECQSPLLYSPPTPFVLSPFSDVDQNEDIYQQKQIPFRPCRQERPIIKANHLQDVDSPASKKNTRSAIENVTGCQATIKQNGSPHKLADQIQDLSLSEQPSKSISELKPKGKKRKKQGKLLHCDENPVKLEPSENAYLSSQFLESPKFGLTVREPEQERDKRFCLFEDEWVKPKNKKKKPRCRSSKSTNVKRQRKQSFSWSPALGCSQYTPKLKKPLDDLFSYSTKTYQRQKKPVVKSKPEGLVKLGKGQERQHKKQARSQKMDEISGSPGTLTPTERSSKLAKYPQNRVAKRKAENQTARSGRSPMPLNLSVDDETGSKTSQIGLPQAKSSRIKKNNQQNRDDKENHQPLHHLKSLHPNRKENVPILRSTVSAPLQLGYQDNTARESRYRLAKHNHDYEEENEEIEYDTAINVRDRSTGCTVGYKNLPALNSIDTYHTNSKGRYKNSLKENGKIEYGTAVNVQDSLATFDVSCNAGRQNQLAQDTTNMYHVNRKAARRNLLKEKQTHYGKGNTDNVRTLSPHKPLLPGYNRPSFEPESALPETAEDNSNRPALPEEADVLRRILFQLKNTTVSNESIAPSSPAPSKMTEASGESMKSISSTGPSPSSHRDIRDLMDDLRPLAHFSPIKTLTTVNKENTYRKRGNILCNMFDASDSDIGVSTKTKRYLPSESQPKESDFSMLFSADIFV